MKDDKEIYSTTEVSINRTILTLPHIKISDEGLYICVAENLVGSSRDKANVFVHGI